MSNPFVAEDLFSLMRDMANRLDRLERAMTSVQAGGIVASRVAGPWSATPLPGLPGAVGQVITIPSAGLYAAICTVSGYVNASAIGGVDVFVNNTFIGNSKLYFNPISQHMVMSPLHATIQLPAGNVRWFVGAWSNLVSNPDDNADLTLIKIGG
jgi:hypothetical protein